MGPLGPRPPPSCQHHALALLSLPGSVVFCSRSSKHSRTVRSRRDRPGIQHGPGSHAWCGVSRQSRGGAALACRSCLGCQPACCPTKLQCLEVGVGSPVFSAQLWLGCVGRCICTCALCEFLPSLLARGLPVSAVSTSAKAPCFALG